MIVKSFEKNKINLIKNNFVLLYGKNEGLKKEITSILLKDKIDIKNYEEKEILDNPENFIESLISQSLFETEKIVIIKRVTDKLIKVIEEIDLKNINDVYIVFNSESLEKRSKLRAFFEKHKTYVCVPFYADTNQTLLKLCFDFFNKKKISITPSNANLIINKCNGDRENLLNELKKIEFFCKNGKRITAENILKLTNLIENHSVSELIDNCLTKNKKKIINILTENNFNNEDCILIIRTFLNKSKKLLKLSNEFENNNNMDLTISSAKPPIFWKDKEITKQQIYKWTPKTIRELIYNLSELELLIKKNINDSVYLITDFILNKSTSNTNN